MVGGVSAVRYSEFAPHPSLCSYVLCYWEYAAGNDIEPFRQHVMPDGCIVLACGRQGKSLWTSLVGPSLKGIKAPIHPGALIRGIRFWPDAGGALLGLDPVSLRDRHMLVEDALPDFAVGMWSAAGDADSPEEAAVVFDHILMPLLDSADPIDDLVRYGIRLITTSGGRLSIGDLATRIGLSERQFQRRFRRASGITPKQYARIRRLRTSVGAALDAVSKHTDPSWGRLAAEQGYADQAHLVREFSQLIGQSPVTFMERTSRIEHVDVKP